MPYTARVNSISSAKYDSSVGNPGSTSRRDSLQELNPIMVRHKTRSIYFFFMFFMFIPRLKCGTDTDHRLPQRREYIVLRIRTRPVGNGEQVGSAEENPDIVDGAGLFQQGRRQRISELNILKPHKARVFDKPARETVVLVRIVKHSPRHGGAGSFSCPAVVCSRPLVGAVAGHVLPSCPVVVVFLNVAHTLEENRQIKSTVIESQVEAIEINGNRFTQVSSVIVVDDTIGFETHDLSWFRIAIHIQEIHVARFLVVCAYTILVCILPFGDLLLVLEDSTCLPSP